jgi:CheY-like chemotaxis protein
MPRISDPEDSQSQPAAAAHNGKKVLLAEDDPFISRMYLTKLAASGYEVHIANNGRDAFDSIKSLRPDFVLLDLNMPELTGFEVLRALQADGETELMKHVIVLTNSAEPKDRQQAVALGVEYMVKAEMTPREVLATINQHLGVS